MRPTLAERIENDFVYHAPRHGQPELYQHIRNTAKTLAILIAQEVPEGREQALAITNIEQAVFWANAGIARSGAPAISKEAYQEHLGMQAWYEQGPEK